VTVLNTEARLLFWKEVRQLSRSRGALVTGVLLPTVLMVLAPVSQLYASRNAGPGGFAVPSALPGLQGMTGAQDFFLNFTFPLFFVLAGLLTPSLAATYTVVSERERRSLELLMSLPVTVTDILAAKVAANLAAAAVTLLPLFVIDAVFVLLLSSAGPLYVLALLVLLLSSLTASIGVSLLLALIARDFRTSNNLSGAFVVPVMALTVVCAALVPGIWRFAVLSLAMLTLGAVAYYASVRWLTFERYLS
jgi:ABC-2 type transport system permease protein